MEVTLKIDLAPRLEAAIERLCAALGAPKVTAEAAPVKQEAARDEAAPAAAQVPNPAPAAPPAPSVSLADLRAEIDNWRATKAEPEINSVVAKSNVDKLRAMAAEVRGVAGELRPSELNEEERARFVQALRDMPAYDKTLPF